MKLVMRLFTSTLAVIISAYLLKGITINSTKTALIAAIVLGTLNVFIKPILVLITLPINIVTLGLFTLVINVTLVMLVSYIVPGFGITSAWWALLFGLVLSLVSSFLNRLVR